jgi:hypothetical protein
MMDFIVQFLQFKWSEKQVTLVIQMYGFAAEKQSVKLVHTGGRKHHSTNGLHND